MAGALVEHCLVFGYYAAGLDGGRSARLCALASLCFWAGAAVLYVRRPKAPTDGDLLYGYLAYPVLVVVVSIIAEVVQ